MAIVRASKAAFPDEEPEFQVAPMIDVLLVLLTFFMSITSTEVMKTKSKLTIELPVAKDGGPKEPRPEIVVNIAWRASAEAEERGTLEVDNQIYKMTSLTELIKQRRGSAENFQTIIRASDDVPYSFVRQVMGASANAGVDQVVFSVVSKANEKKFKKPTP